MSITKNNPAVSVCILTYFHEKYILNTLNSVLSQKVDFKYEIVISDDCSTDNTIPLINEFKKSHPSTTITIIKNEHNLGIPKNLYQTLRAAKGLFITLLDGDDVFLDNCKLQRQYDFLTSQKGEGYLGVSTFLERITINSERTGKISPQPRFKNVCFSLKCFLKGYNFPTNGLMFRNVLISESDIEYFSAIIKCSDYIDDLTFCLLLLMKGNVFMLDCIGVGYRSRQDSKDEHNFNSINSRYSSFKKHIELLNNFHLLYPHINLIGRYKKLVYPIYIKSLFSKQLPFFNSIYNTIPKEYKRRGVFSLKFKALVRAPFYLIKKLFN